MHLFSIHDAFDMIRSRTTLKQPQSIAQVPGLQGQIHSHGGAGGHETDEDRGLGVEPRAPLPRSSAVPCCPPVTAQQCPYQEDGMPSTALREIALLKDFQFKDV